MQVPSSDILARAQRVRELRAQGCSIVDLGAGEPSEGAPPNARRVAARFAMEGNVAYTNCDGLPALKTAIVTRLREDRQIEVDTDNVLVSAGSKPLLYCALKAHTRPGSLVLLIKPYWTSYPAIVDLTGASPVFLETASSDGFECRTETLERAMSPCVGWLVLNSPCNPTGAVYGVVRLRKLAAVLDRHPHVHILIDEVYNELTFNGGHCPSLLQVAPRLADRIVLLDSFSKSFAMTGWRVGYAVGPRELIRKMTQIQMHTLNCAAAPSQIAALEALTSCRDYPARMREIYRRKRDVMVAGLSAVPGLSFRPPAAALFVFADVREYMSLAHTADEAALADRLLCEAGVNVIPGRAFGVSGYWRISFTADMETLAEGARRLTSFLNRLSRGGTES